MSEIRLLAVEPDDRYWRTVLGELSGDLRFTEVRRAQDADEAVRLLDTFRPTVALIDLTVPAMRAMELLQRLSGARPATGIVGTADALDDGRVGFALSAGVAACLPKSAPGRLIVATLLDVAAGGLPIQREVAARPQLLSRVITDFQRRSSRAAASGLACPLTARERSILDMVAGGHANKEIGVALFISERTVKNHMTNILAKLTARDRAHAVRIGMENGWTAQGAWQVREEMRAAA